MSLTRLEHKLWHSICEVHYIAGCLLLNDVNKAEGEQLRGCVQQLNQILMTQDYHPEHRMVSRALESKTLDLYGKCAMELGELDKAESLFLRLRNLSKVRSSLLTDTHNCSKLKLSGYTTTSRLVSAASSSVQAIAVCDGIARQNLHTRL